jgi:branched-chain amino acid transport system ATP-binding protein
MNPNVLLSINDISMRFGGLQALKNIQFEITKNKVTGLIGPNGAGKTTLFNCLTGFYKPSEGAIFLHHESAKKMIPLPKKSYQVARLGIARTFQNIRLFKEMTVIENLLIAQHQAVNNNLFSGLLGLSGFFKKENRAIETAYAWLDFFHLTNCSNQLAGSLSYGQQRYIEIARALCTSPRLLCLDEPAAGMNPQETQELCRLIQKLMTEHDMTVLLIEHDMSLIMKICDHIIVLDHGNLIAEGSPTEIKKNPAVVSAYLGIDS